ncbi:MAG: tRNA lysidine(34) synthetase TilS [Gallionella sp.]
MTSSSHLTERVASQIAPLIPAHSAILIGLSGGVDSVVLLHLLHKLTPRFSWQLSALHVHHGISPNADAWAEFCTDLCVRYAIPLCIKHVDIVPLREHGIEAAARKLRHAAFAGQRCDFVALAHHADDQAETLLLQLLRGAGVRGAAAMRLLAVRANSAKLLRPLLHCSRQEIMTYAAEQGLQWIEDESNADDSYPRNYLRHRVMPLLENQFPAYRDTLARSAQHFANASDLLDERAQQDAPDLFPFDKTTSHSTWLPKFGSQVAAYPISGIGVGREGDELLLDVSRLQSLSQPRAKNLLRYFLYQHNAPMPQAAQLDDMLRQLSNARPDAAVCISYGDREVRRYQGKVYVLRALGEFDRNFVLSWHGETELFWPALNAQIKFTHAQHSQGVGISLAKLQRAPVTLRLRRGGEILRPQLQAATRTLKNLLQEHHVPPWQRDRLPLLHCGDELICVPGVAVAVEYQSADDEEGIAVNFCPTQDIPDGKSNSSPTC